VNSYYYQYDEARLSTCVLTVHALLHIGDSVAQIGPVWASWAFPMERYCGTLQRALRSRRFPYACLDRYIYQDAMLGHLKNKFGIHGALQLSANKSETGHHVPGCKHLHYHLKALDAHTRADDHCMFYPPHTKTFRPSLHLLAKISHALLLRFGIAPQHRNKIRSHLPAILEEWGKLRILPAGDMIRSLELGEAHAAVDNRSAAFVRVSAMAISYLYIMLI
jgi:hypothetical protein